MSAKDKMLLVYQHNPGIGRKRLMREAGVSAGVAQRFLEEQRKGQTQDAPAKPPADTTDNIVTEYGSDKGCITTRSTKITNLDEALEAAKVDRSVWEVDRHIINWWDVTFKTPGGESRTVPNFQIKVWLKPKVKKHIAEALKDLLVDLSGPKAKPATLGHTDNPHMLELSFFDLHFGKLAWSAETGTDYDIKIAEQLFSSAVKNLLAHSKSFNVNKILLPIGSDFLHVNGANNCTVNNTPQDVDTRLVKIFKAACKMVVSAVEECASIAPVEVLFVPGNHDRDTAFYLCSFLEAWFHRHEGVTVDVGPKSRKYVRYGTNLLGFTHGDEEKSTDLPLLMAGEMGEAWGYVTHREWHIGHFHKSKEMKFVSGDSHGPVVVRVLPSLSGTDAWHYRKGYVCGNRAAEAYLWSYKNGYTGHFSTNIQS